MKSLKVFYMGQRLRDIYPHATKWQVLKWRIREFLKLCVRITTWTGLTATILYLVFMAGSYFNPIITYAVKEQIKEVDSQAPVMDRIAKCESQSKHFAKNGQVLVMGNTNKSVDVGKYQINQQVWGAKATELGYNIFTEEGNKSMAYWIYKNHGTEPWYSSQKCWQ